MDFGPDGKETMEGMIFQVVAQKIIVLNFIFTLLITSIGSQKIFRTLN